jgi:hypothetical protein
MRVDPPAPGVPVATVASRSSGAALPHGSAHLRRPGMRARGLRAPALGALVCLLAYLYGSLPLLYLRGRRWRVDLRDIGSGNVGATNLMAAGDRAGAISGWIFDASKGVVPIAAARALNCPAPVAELAGVCGVAGQCWPVFLGFRGGRGISSYVGAAALIDRGAWAGALLPMIAGSLWRVVPRMKRRRAGPARRTARSKAVPLGCFVSAVVFPPLCGLRRGFGPEQMLAPTLLSLIILGRRVTAPQPDDATLGPAVRPQALLYRLLLDRNTSA